MRVIVEIVPFGDERAKRTIATINIANKSDLSATSNYEIWGTEETLGAFRSVVIGHLRAHGWMPLVRSAIWQLFEAWSSAPGKGGVSR